MRIDTFWYDLLRFVNFRCHDQARSDLPLRYDHIRSDRIVAIEFTIGSGSDTIITIGLPELGWSDTCRYVPIRSSRTDALRYDSIRLWSRCFSRSWSRLITIWATTGPRRVYICSRTDHRLHCFLNFYSINTYPQPLMMAGVRMMTTWYLQYYCIVTLSPERKKTSSRQTSYNPNHKGPGELSQAVLGATMAQRGELVADRERSCKNLTTRIYSHLLASSRINSCLIVNHSCQVLSNVTRQSVTNRDRSWEIATHLNRTWCLSCPRSIPITTIWKHD